MTTTCPNGHQSMTSDYCDQCGAKLDLGTGDPSAAAGPAGGAPGGAPAAGAAQPVPVGSGCPNCQSPHGPHDKFCEVCGYDFVAGTLPAAPEPVPADPAAAADGGSGAANADPSVVAPAPEGTAGSAASASSTGSAAVAGSGRTAGSAASAGVSGSAASAGVSGSAGSAGSATGGPAWTAVVCADRDYYDSTASSDMPFPDHCPERVFALTADEILIGRRSESRGIHPQIDLSGAPEDTGISRSHAILRRQADGTFAVIDPGSTNGTMVNDDPQPLAHNVVVPLKDGDRVYLGGWTKIVLHAPSGS